MPTADQMRAWQRRVHIGDVTEDEVEAMLRIMRSPRDYPTDMIRAYRAGRASRRTNGEASRP